MFKKLKQEVLKEEFVSKIDKSEVEKDLLFGRLLEEIQEVSELDEAPYENEEELGKKLNEGWYGFHKYQMLDNSYSSTGIFNKILYAIDKHYRGVEWQLSPTTLLIGGILIDKNVSSLDQAQSNLFKKFVLPIQEEILNDKRILDFKKKIEEIASEYIILKNKIEKYEKDKEKKKEKKDLTSEKNKLGKEFESLTDKFFGVFPKIAKELYKKYESDLKKKKKEEKIKNKNLKEENEFSEEEISKELGKIEIETKEVSEENFEGGVADFKSVDDIAEKHGVEVDQIMDQLQKGIEIELEHTDNRKEASEIAKDHLIEYPDYYDRLEKMEAEAEEELKQKLKESQDWRTSNKTKKSISSYFGNK